VHQPISLMQQAQQGDEPMVMLGDVSAVPPGTLVLRVQAGLIREGTAVTLASENAATKPASAPASSPATGN
jgi:membrane fusion protein (multidrug efflux system)